MDDATSEIHSAFLVDEEGTMSSFLALGEVIAAHGLPCALYPETAFVTDVAGAHRDILCVQEEWVIGNDNTVRYRGLSLQIPQSPIRPHFVKVRVRVHDYPDGTLAIFHGLRCLARYRADGSPLDQ